MSSAPNAVRLSTLPVTKKAKTAARPSKAQTAPDDSDTNSIAIVEQPDAFGSDSDSDTEIDPEKALSKSLPSHSDKRANYVPREGQTYSALSHLLVLQARCSN